MSNNQIIETFLAQQNLQQHYKFVTESVKKRTGINIDRYPGMKRQFQSMAQILAKKREGQNVHLSQLNSDLQNHCSNYFCNQLEKKKMQKQHVNKLNATNEMHTPNEMQQQSFNRNNSINNDYEKLMATRNENLSMRSYDEFDPRKQIASRGEINSKDNTNLTKSLENALLERGQINDIPNNIPDNEKPNILPFNLNDDVSNMLSRTDPGEDLPLYQNVVELNNSENSDPMKRLEQIEKERNINNKQTMENATSILDYKKLDINDQQKLMQKFTTRKGESDIMAIRNNTDAQTLNQRSEIKDATELYKLNEEGKQRMIDRMTNSGISGNDTRALSPLVDNLLIEKLISLQRDLQPNYIEKVNYIIINSVDRDWFNTNESRYNFRVNFKPHSSHTGAGIQDIYRNITSVELVNAILPQDNVLIPFDSRPYLDILHFPYLLLQIKEFSDVFRGTNNNNDRAFSVLIFDKQHDSSVLSSDYITSDVNGSPKSQFYKEYRKTFYKYTPAYFEKKNFYNQPLASLGHMTLNLETPAGENINVLNDVLTINDIQYTSNLSNLETTESTTFEYNVAHGFPGENMSDHKYIRINTSTAFSNKLFRLGDNIKISGYSLTGSGSDNDKFVSFINRDEGHYILNTDITNVSNTTGANQGFVSNIYISPPGELNSTLTGLKANTYYDETNIDLGNYTEGSAKLINGNLQTHFLFKINTREGDVSRITMPMNV